MSGVSLLGSTGSIGVQTLDVMRAHGLRPCALAANKNVRLMEAQVREFRPQLVGMADEVAGRDLAVRLRDLPVRVVWGAEGPLEAAGHPGAGRVLNALSGLSGLLPTMAALEAGKELLLANKESLVCAGHLVTARAAEKGVRILPVDSEHSAIHQCLKAGTRGLRRLILTASGGAFRGWSRQELQSVTPDMALRHPNWDMGAKVTVDSSTLLNKGLEVIEAIWLFGVDADRVSVLVHPQSIVHSLVEYDDGAMIAQLGTPDMRIPIQYALLDEERRPCPAPSLDLAAMPGLTFEHPDRESFPCLELALGAARRGGNSGAVLAASGEAAVDLFLRGRLGFMDIPRAVEKALGAVPFERAPTLEGVLAADAEARKIVENEVLFC